LFKVKNQLLQAISQEKALLLHNNNHIQTDQRQPSQINLSEE